MAIKYKNFIFIASLIILLILSSSLLFWKIISANTPDNPEDPYGLNIDIGVCVDPPSPDLTDPSQPIFSWTTYGNPQVKYWLRVDDSGFNFPSPELNTGEVISTNHSYQAPLGQLAQNKTYHWTIAASDAHGWTAWTGCGDFFLPDRQPSAENLTTNTLNYCNLTGNLSWTFNDPDYQDSQTAYQIQVDNDPAFASPEIDTGKLNFSSSFYLLDLKRLSYDTTYYWHLKVWDRIGPEESGWINGSSFITPKHQGPSADFNWTAGVLMDNDTVLVKFIDNSTVYGNATKSAWFWTFDNGSPLNAVSKNPSSSFPSSVSQSNVTLRTTDSDNYSCQTTKVVDITGLRNKLKEIIPR